MSRTAIDMEALERDGFVWVENLTPHPARFTQRSTGLTYEWERTGYAGSIAEVPRRIAGEPYIRRNLKRGRIRFVDPDEAEARNAELEPWEEGAQGALSGREAILDALAAGADERVGKHFTREGLSDYGESRVPLKDTQIWSEEERSRQAAAPVTPQAQQDPDFDPNESGVAPSPTDMTGEVIIERPQHYEGSQ